MMHLMCFIHYRLGKKIVKKINILCSKDALNSDFYIVTKYFYFTLLLFFETFYLSEHFEKILDIRMISE